MLPEDLQDLQDLAEMGNCRAIHLRLLSASVRCTPGHGMCFCWGKNDAGKHPELGENSKCETQRSLQFPVQCLSCSLKERKGAMLPECPNVSQRWGGSYHRMEL